MSREGYSPEKKESDNKAVLERLQSYLKDKKNTDVSDTSAGYSKPSTSYDPNPNTVPNIEDSSNILREVLNYKKAELLRQPDVTDFLKAITKDLKK